MKIKVLNDFQPKKTSLCITSTSEKNGVISKQRTLKAMRAALAGLPIITPKWASHCIEHERIMSPENSMYIQTLPTKERHFMKIQSTDNSVRDCTAHGGVLAFGALHEHAASKKEASYSLLEGLSVNLCGGWKKTSSKTKDILLLLKEGGATVLSSPNDVMKTLSKGTENDRSTLVLLCDSPINSICSTFPKNLKESIEGAITEKQTNRTILIVNASWIFDCISCARILGAKHYKPEGSLIKSLWEKCENNS